MPGVEAWHGSHPWVKNAYKDSIQVNPRPTSPIYTPIMYNYDTLTQLIDVMNRLTMLIYWGNGAALNQNYPQGRANCYELPRNSVFEFKKELYKPGRNWTSTTLLTTIYILHSASCLLPLSSSHVLFFILCHHLVSSSLYYITSLSWNEANSLHYPPSKIVSSWYQHMFS